MNDAHIKLVDARSRGDARDIKKYKKKYKRAKREVGGSARSAGA